MDKNKARPVFLNLFKLHLPIGGQVSILHRISGFVLILVIPFVLYGLQLSLASEAGYRRVLAWLSSDIIKAMLFVVFVVLTQHFFSGVRHLLLDIDVMGDKQPARVSAWSTFVATVGVSIWVGWRWW